MNSKKKTILAIVIVVLVLILGGAAVYVATQMSTRQAVAPTAPTSKPRASGTAQLGEVCGTIRVATSGAEVTAMGGAIATISGYTIHTFTTSGTFTVTGSGNVEVLVVGGGGGGGGDNGGGGGGGGVLYNASYAVTAQPYTVTIGAGGKPGKTNTDSSTNGENSVFGTITAVGGGKGATGEAGKTQAGIGGSGGGGDGERPTNGASGTSGQGYAGGKGVQVKGGAGGGGGAGAVGADATTSKGGKGGDGVAYDISGTSTYYGGGGGGGNNNAITGFAAGGNGGGGASAFNTAVSGTANTGGGGGGGTYKTSAVGGSGGPGIVIVRYKTETKTVACDTGLSCVNGSCVKATYVGSTACTTTGKVPGTVGMTLTKEAYQDESSNTAGVYTKNTQISVADDGETYVYHMLAKNTGTSTTSATITDVLTGNNLDILTFVDSTSNCTYVSSTRTVTCPLGSIDPGKAEGAAFRVTVPAGTADETTITNKATLTYGASSIQATKDVTINNPSDALLTGSKTAYKNATSNTAGKYTLTTEMDTVSKSQTYVYAITLTNDSSATATGVTVKDSLAELTNLTFVDAVDGCTWDSTNMLLTCGETTINKGATKTFAFRVKASAGIANGDIISNTATVTYNGEELSLTKDLTVSTVVGCNNTCTTDEECTSGLTCDPTTSKCRLAACLTEDDCVCATTVKTTTTTTTTKTVTAAPTKVVATKSATPTILPETGILDIPGVAAFGGGLFLAVVGILLAL